MWKAAVLLVLSNVFMTIAWYGHLKFKHKVLWATILVSWLIALPEYCLQVPANRIGHNEGISAAQLKVMQELITFAVFGVFSVAVLREPLRANMLVGFGLMVAGVAIAFYPWAKPA